MIDTCYCIISADRAETTSRFLSINFIKTKNELRATLRVRICLSAYGSLNEYDHLVLFGRIHRLEADHAADNGGLSYIGKSYGLLNKLSFVYHFFNGRTMTWSILLYIMQKWRV